MTITQTPPSAIADGLTDDEKAMVKLLLETLDSKKSRNSLRLQYYNGLNRLKDLGISIPPPLKSIETVVGWPAKAVDALASRSQFDGFVFPDGDGGDALADMLQQNDFDNLYRMLVPSELINSCAFVTVSAGAAGEPDVMVNAYSALNASAIWNSRKKRIDYGMTVVEADKDGKPTWVNLYTDTSVIQLHKTDDVAWTAERVEHLQGRPLMEPLVYRQSLDRPFGRSRITRAVMSITDSAVRTALRSEVASEFYTAPQKYIMGAEDDLFKDQTKWEAYIGSFLALSRNDGDTLPQVGQFPQMSMQPLIDYMRSLAARFSGETNIPVSALGIIHDNPSSADAIYAANEPLIIEANGLNASNGRALRNVAMLVMAMMENKPMSELTKTQRRVTAKFRPAATPSAASMSDAILKQVSAIPWIGETSVAIESLGYDESQIMRMKSEKRKADGQKAISTLASMNNGE